MNWTLRLARLEDVSAIAELIPLSVRALQAAYYTTAQMEAAIGPVFGVDRQLINDGTYFVAERDGQLAGCGGWSRRKSLCGSDQDRPAGTDTALDPERDPARIRAFFVRPDCARQGIGRAILLASEEAARKAGFRQAELVGTLAGEPLYAVHGYLAVERYELPMRDGLGLPVVRMTKRLEGATVADSRR